MEDLKNSISRNKTIKNMFLGFSFGSEIYTDKATMLTKVSVEL